MKLLITTLFLAFAFTSNAQTSTCDSAIETLPAFLGFKLRDSAEKIKQNFPGGIAKKQGDSGVEVFVLRRKDLPVNMQKGILNIGIYFFDNRVSKIMVNYTKTSTSKSIDEFIEPIAASLNLPNQFQRVMKDLKDMQCVDFYISVSIDKLGGFLILEDSVAVKAIQQRKKEVDEQKALKS